jgi:hypothetical protein
MTWEQLLLGKPPAARRSKPKPNIDIINVARQCLHSGKLSEWEIGLMQSILTGKLVTQPMHQEMLGITKRCKVKYGDDNG